MFEAKLGVASSLEGQRGFKTFLGLGGERDGGREDGWGRGKRKRKKEAEEEQE